MEKAATMIAGEAARRQRLVGNFIRVTWRELRRTRAARPLLLQPNEPQIYLIDFVNVALAADRGSCIFGPASQSALSLH
jgi:hypothetical protein